MVYDKTGIIYGSYREYSFAVEENASAGLFTVHFWAKPTDSQLGQDITAYLEGLKKDRGHIRYAGVNNGHVTVQMKIFANTDRNRQNIEDALAAITDYLGRNAFRNSCANCGKEDDLSLCQINGACVQLCGDCYHASVSSMSAEEQQAKLRKGNMVTGIVGALIGALIGGVLWVLVAQLGYIAGIIGLVTAVLALKGYELLGGKIDKLGIVITMIIIVLALFAANYMSLAWAIHSEFSKIYDITFFDAFQAVPDFLSEGEIMGAFIKDLLIGYVFTAAVSVPVIRNMYNRSNKKFRARLLGD